MPASQSASKGALEPTSLMARLAASVCDAALCAPPPVVSDSHNGTGPASGGLESFSDTVTQAVQSVPLNAFSVKSGFPLVSPLRNGASSLADDPAGFRHLQRELCLLVSILQRPKHAYKYWLGYSRFIAALRTVNVVEQIAKGMEAICAVASEDAARRSSNVFSNPFGDGATEWYEEILRRYSEALLLYVFYHSDHTRTTAASASSTGAPAGGLLDRHAVAALLASTAEEPAIAPSTASTLFRVARRLAGESSRSHQSSAVMLTCTLCAPGFQGALPLPDLREAAETVAQAPDAVSHLVMVASVPYWVVGRQVVLDDDSSSSTDKAIVEWLRTAVSVCTRATMYDADVSLLFRHDGTRAPTFPLVKEVVGGVYASLWDCLSPDVWYLFTKAALWSAAKSMGLYAFAWNGLPRALAPLLSLVQFQLGQFGRKRGPSAIAPSASAAAAGSLSTTGPSTSKALNANFNALLSGAMGVSPYEPSAHSVLNSPDPDLTAARQRNAQANAEDGAGNEEDESAAATGAGRAGRNGNFTMAFSFATERAHTTYYLSIYAYVVSVLPFLFERFGDVCNTLQWMVPSELYQRAAQGRSSVEGGDACAQDTLSRASGWLQNVSDFLVTVDAADDERAIDVQPYLTFPMPPRFTEPGKVNLLSQLMELLTMVAQSGATGLSAQTHSANNTLLARLAESALALLHGLLTCYPHEVSAMSQFAHVDLLSTLQHVALWQLSLPFPTFHAQELTYSLLHRYFTVFPNLQVLASKLLKPEVLRAVGRQPNVAERLVLDDYLYARLLECDDDASGLFVQPILAALCDVPEGTIASTIDGGHLFVGTLTTLLKAIQYTPRVSLRRLFEEGPLRVDVLVRRLCEGLLCLYKQWVAGNTYMDNHSTLRLLDITLQVVTQTLCITQTGYDDVSRLVMASTAEPYAPPSLVDPATCGIYAAVRLLFCPDLDSLDLVERAAELLALCTSRASTPLFTALHTTCSQDAAVAVAQDVLDALRRQEGQAENVHRLEALVVVLRHDWHLFHFLTGSDTLPDNAHAKSLHELALVKYLKATVVGNKAIRLEQAAALSLLRALGDNDSVPASRVAELLDRTQPNPMSNTFETVALAAACVEHMNARVARGMAASSSSSGSTPAGGAPVQSPHSPRTPRLSSTGSGGGGGGTPLQRSAAASMPSTPRQTFTKLDREQSDAVDKACRGGTRALQEGLQFLSKLLSNLFYEERVSLIGEPGAPSTALEVDGTRADALLDVTRTNQRTLSRAGGAAFSPIVGAATRTAVASPLTRLAQDEASLQLPTTTRRHQLSNSLLQPRAAATATRSSVLRGHPFHTSVLPDPIDEEATLYAKPYPLVLGTAYCFQDTEDDPHFNAIASILESMGRLAVAMERAMYLSSRDPDRTALFLSRTLATLESSLHCLLVLKPTMPLLNSALWSYMGRCLQLTLALSRSVRAAHVLDESEFSDSLRAALDGLGKFAFENRRHLSVVNACLEVAYSVPAAVFADYNTLAAFFTTAQFALVAHVADVSLRVDVVALVHNVTSLTASALSSCPVPTLTVLVQTLWRHAENVSHAIRATAAAEGPAVAVLVACVQCLKTCLSHTEEPVLLLTLLPRESILRMLVALGQFRRAELYEATRRVYQRQAWQAAWVAVLELLHSVILFHPASHNSESAVAAIGDDWPLSIAEVLTTLPRFAEAVGGFDLAARRAVTDSASAPSSVPTPPTPSSLLFVWDVEEIELCTRVTAALSAVGHHLPRLFPLVQNAFVSLHRFRILRYCTASDNSVEVVAAESRRVEIAVARAVCSQLRVLLQWPTKAMPTSENGYPALSFPCFHRYAAVGEATGAVVHQRDVSRFDQRRARETSTAAPSQDAEQEVRTLVDAVSLSMDVLRRFIVDELQLVRRLSAMDPSRRGHSPDRSASTRPQSRESSVTRSPAMGRASGLYGAAGAVGDSLLYDDAETVATDDDSGTLAGDSGVALHMGVGTVHIECVQLALALFTAAATECLYGQTVISGHFDSLTFQRDLLASVNKLLDALDSVHKDIRKANSPALTAAVDAMRLRLRTIKATLLS